MTITGAGSRGLSYAVLELADIVEYSDEPIEAMRAVATGEHRPTTPIRSVLRTMVSEVQDLTWYHDRDFWRTYLTHLATHRINRFQLAFGMQYNYSHDPNARDNYLAFAYPFLVDVPGFDVQVSGIDAAEKERNLATLRFISREAARRGLHFQLGLWNHAYEFPESPQERYPIKGLSAQNHATYCREALRAILLACPDIAGITVRVHYEGGVHEPTHEFWDVVLRALREVGRPVELDLHSKGLDDRILTAARKTGAPFQVSAKFWAEHWGLPYHQAAVRDMESARPDREDLSGVTRGSRRFTRYGYGDFLTADRDFGMLFRVWPGTQRVLQWGDPAQVAAIARSTALIGGQGVELCEPLTFLGRKTTGSAGGRRIYDDPELELPGDPWTKYSHTYRLWGRLLYEPDHDPEGWRRELRSAYAAAAGDVEAALAAASKILPLVTTQHAPSASNNFYWPEMYTAMPLARSAPSELYGFDTPEPGTVGAVGPFDPELFETIDSYTDDLLGHRQSGKYTPAEVAQWLDDLAEAAETHLASAVAKSRHAGAPTFRRTAVDIAVLARLGAYFADTTRAGIAYALHTRLHGSAYLRAAVRHARQARDAYAAIADLTTGVYVGDLAFGDRASERGHWADRLPAIDRDLADLEDELAGAQPSSQRGTVTTVPEAGQRPIADWQVPGTFEPGSPIAVRVTLAGDVDCRVDLHYRHLNQAEQWVSMGMSARGHHHEATIPEPFTRTDYSIQLYFTVRDAQGEAWIVPGLDTLTSQPYLVLQHA
ncbi:MAG TPA: hypothetical protein H9815_15785 [Candidatus Ruania gallistercoris]|uniref:Uncharacterized protein n=1 Tax=Candidatus Ruania gallistercoris TaxID=2838746 RepID=A0A9D2J5C1_9MICO|nr:hypothetical protein [Candidatus Ruania gallistercoris]